MLNDMAGYMSIVMNLFFVFMLHEIIQAATQPIPHIHMFWPLVLLMGGTLGIMLYYLGQFRRAAKGDDDGDPAKRTHALTCSATAAANSWVVFFPPKSGVRTRPAAITAFSPVITRAAAAASPRCSNIMAEAQMAAMGLAMPRPAMSGALPCTGSNTGGPRRSTGFSWRWRQVPGCPAKRLPDR